MNLDTVKIFFQNERNKVIGIGVASCLITTAVVAPITYFTGQPKYKGVINPVAFNTVSATGEHLADYGNLDVIEGEPGWGNEENITYVTTDTDLTKDVLDVKNGIGFQAKNVAEKEAENVNNSLNVMSAEFDEEMVSPSSTNYELVAPINIYMRVPAPVSIFFKENLMFTIDGIFNENSIWDSDFNKGSLESLNGVYSDTEDGNLKNSKVLKSYFDWVNGNNYLDDLLMDFTFFNWMLFNEKVEGYPDAPNGTNNPKQLSGTVAFKTNVKNMLDNVQGWTTDEIKADNSTTTIEIAGTGTDDPYVHDEQADLFNEADITNIEGGKDFGDITTNLTNEGSSTAWYMPKDKITFTGQNGDEWNLEAKSPNSYTPPANAFIGTQSRRSYYGSYTNTTTDDKSISGMSQWGYGYQSTAATGDNEWNYMEQPSVDDIGGTIKEDSFGEQKDSFGDPIVDDPYANEIPWDYTNEMMDTSIALPLGFTATTDPLVFFTASDTTFEHKANDSNPKGIYKPIGMTPEGTKLIFENPSQEPNITWEFLFSNGFIKAQEV